jgi:MFS family permease
MWPTTELEQRLQNLGHHQPLAVDISGQCGVSTNPLGHPYNHRADNLFRIAWGSPAYALWVVDLETNYTFISYGQAVLVIACGVGVFFLQPAALNYGSRGPYLIGSILILIGLICGLVMTRVGLYFAYMALAGFGSAPSYSTIVTSLLDVSFLHRKGRMISIYGLVLIAGNFLPPLATGYIVDTQGWQWCFRYLLMFFGVSTLLMAFAVEETSFPRDAHHSHVVSNGVPVKVTAAHDDDRTSLDAKPPTNVMTRTSTAGSHSTSINNQTQSSEPRHSYWQRMSIYRYHESIKAGYWSIVFASVRLATLPAPVWASIQLVVSTFLVGVVMTTLASLFSIHPYNFNTAQMGLMYITLLLASLVGAYLGGPATDWLVLRMAKRNGGVHEPEHRLLAWLPVPFLAAGGTLLYGLGAYNQLHWMVPCMGLFLIGIYLNLSLPVCLGYAFDCYTSLEDETAQLTNTIRNVGGGVLMFAVQPWINASGVKNTTIIVSAIVFAVHMTGLVFQSKGNAIRRRYAPTYYNLLERIYLK